MLKLVKGCNNRTGLTETVLVISISVCIKSTLYSVVHLIQISISIIKI